MTIVTLSAAADTRIPETARATAAGREGHGLERHSHDRHTSDVRKPGSGSSVTSTSWSTAYEPQ